MDQTQQVCGEKKIEEETSLNRNTKYSTNQCKTFLFKVYKKFLSLLMYDINYVTLYLDKKAMNRDEYIIHYNALNNKTCFIATVIYLPFLHIFNLKKLRDGNKIQHI